MSSSFYLLKRFEDPKKYDYGKWYDHSLREWGECHPDFNSIVFKYPNGQLSEARMCVRKPKVEMETKNINGHYKQEKGLYHVPGVNYSPRQLSEYLTHDERSSPDEYLMKNNYFKDHKRYNKPVVHGVGLKGKDLYH